MAQQGVCDLGFARLDIDRKARRGFAEAIYSPGKKREHLRKIALEFKKNKQDLLFTRLDKKTFTYLKKAIPRLNYNPIAKLAYLRSKTGKLKSGLIVVASAGTSDMPAAEEAAATAEAMGNKVIRLYDVGVAGVHRVMQKVEILRKARVIIVVAGMEGALGSLVSGLVSCPVIAVPTSCGYGASFSGLSALLTMLNSCSPGVAVVNIDNGFGAGYMASVINNM